MQIISYLAVAMLVGLVSLPSYAHEFWMEPSDFQPRVGDKVTVDLVIGDNFEIWTFPRFMSDLSADQAVALVAVDPWRVT